MDTTITIIIWKLTPLAILWTWSPSSTIPNHKWSILCSKKAKISNKPFFINYSSSPSASSVNQPNSDWYRLRAASIVPSKNKIASNLSRLKFIIYWLSSSSVPLCPLKYCMLGTCWIATHTISTQDW